MRIKPGIRGAEIRRLGRAERVRLQAGMDWPLNDKVGI